MKHMTHTDRVKCCTMRIRGYSVRAIGIALGLPTETVREYLNSRPSAELHAKEGEK